MFVQLRSTFWHFVQPIARTATDFSYHFQDKRFTTSLRAYFVAVSSFDLCNSAAVTANLMISQMLSAIGTIYTCREPFSARLLSESARSLLEHTKERRCC